MSMTEAELATVLKRARKYYASDMGPVEDQLAKDVEALAGEVQRLRTGLEHPGLRQATEKALVQVTAERDEALARCQGLRKDFIDACDRNVTHLTTIDRLTAERDEARRRIDEADAAQLSLVVERDQAHAFTDNALAQLETAKAALDKIFQYAWVDSDEYKIARAALASLSNGGA